MSRTDAAPLEAVPLPTPCWWIDRGDCWESTCHPTREAAEADHVARVRLSNGEDPDTIVAAIVAELLSGSVVW